jgi:hypothetical protein
MCIIAFAFDEENYLHSCQQDHMEDGVLECGV